MKSQLFSRINRFHLVVLIFFIFSFLQSQGNVTFGFGEVNQELGTMEITMVNSDPVHTYNIFISGIIVNEVYGGVSEEYNFDININNSNGHHIHGHTHGMDGALIPPGSHTLLVIDFSLNYDLICIYTGSCQGDGMFDFDIELDNCITSEIDEDGNGYFGELLNGYTDEYEGFADTSGFSNISYVTIESAPDLDYGDEIGLLSLEGLTNFGDCSSEIGEILVGADTWYGGPITIPAYGSMDFCDEDGFQIPGFNSGESVFISVWDSDELVVYTMDLFLRDEIPWGNGHIVISDMNFDTIIALGGDVDDDNEQTVLDVVILVSIILGTTDASPEQIIIANLNGDDTIDILDVVILVNIILEEQ